MPLDNEQSLQDRAMAIFAQKAPPAADGGRRILYRCPNCGHPWLMDGRRMDPRPDPETLERALVELGANLATLPYGLCRICGAQGIGEVCLDAYVDYAGYGISWEGVIPVGHHLIVTCGLPERMMRAEQRAARSGGSIIAPAPDYRHMRRWLKWLQELQYPDAYLPFSPEIAATLASGNRPGHGAPGTEQFVWRGAAWVVHCPPLGGMVQTTIGQAMPPDQPYSLALSIHTTRLLATLMLEGHHPGETPEDREG